MEERDVEDEADEQSIDQRIDQADDQSSMCACTDALRLTGSEDASKQREEKQQKVDGECFGENQGLVMLHQGPTGRDACEERIEEIDDTPFERRPKTGIIGKEEIGKVDCAENEAEDQAKFQSGGALLGNEC